MAIPSHQARRFHDDYEKPFAHGGTFDVPELETQSDGTMSHEEGWGPDYELDLLSDPDAKPVARPEQNGALYDVTYSVGDLQRYGAPVFADYAGSWKAGNIVWHDNRLWRAIRDNFETPGQPDDPNDPPWIKMSGETPSGAPSKPEHHTGPYMPGMVSYSDNSYGTQGPRWATDHDKAILAGDAALTGYSVMSAASSGITALGGQFFFSAASYALSLRATDGKLGDHVTMLSSAGMDFITQFPAGFKLEYEVAGGVGTLLGWRLDSADGIVSGRSLSTHAQSVVRWLTPNKSVPLTRGAAVSFVPGTPFVETDPVRPVGILHYGTDANEALDISDEESGYVGGVNLGKWDEQLAMQHGDRVPIVISGHAVVKLTAPQSTHWQVGWDGSPVTSNMAPMQILKTATYGGDTVAWVYIF